MRDPLGFLQRTAETYGDVAQFKIGSLTIVLVNHPTLIGDVLVTSAAKFIRRLASPQLRAFLGDSLFTNPGGEPHRRQRRLVQPAFHRARLIGYSEVITQCSYTAATRWKHNEVRSIAAEMSALTLDAACRTLFSTDISHEAQNIRAALTEILRFDRWRFPGAQWLLRPSGPWGRKFTRAKEHLDNIVYGIIRERRVGEKKDTGDLLSMLLLTEDAEQPGEYLSDIEVRDQVLTLMFAGHETSSQALSWLWWLLATHPEVEAKLHQELADVLDGRPPTLTDIPRLPYLNCVIREVLRVRPPLWGMVRIATSDHILGGYTIAAGTQVLLAPWVTQHDPRFYDQPQRFMPERWTPEFQEGLPKFAYFPFGGGPRICIGENFAWMELALIVASLAQQWRFRITPKTRAVVKVRAILQSEGEIVLRFERRRA